MDDCDDRKETHDEIECDMNEDIVLLNVPIEKDEANREGYYADYELLFEIDWSFSGTFYAII